MGLFAYTKTFIVNTAMPARRTPFTSGPQNWTRRIFEGVADAWDALASTDAGKGASQVGIEDAGGNFTSTTVEGALAELAAGGGGGGGGVTGVTASSPLASSGGATPDISLTGPVSVSLGGTGMTSAGALGNVLTSDGTDWTSVAPANVNVGNSCVAVGDGTGITGSTDLAYYSGILTLEVTNTVAVTNGANVLTLQSGSVSTDAASLTVDAASTVQIGGTGAVSIAGVYTLPSTDGASGDVLTTDGAGAISWQAVAGGGGLGPTNKVHYVVQGGSYATIQAAIDAAADLDVIFVGPKTGGGSWGAATFSAGKRLVVIGMQAKYEEHAQIDSVTFSPSTGLNILLNTIYIRGLFINSDFSVTPGVTFGGTAPGRLRLQECYVYNSGASGTGVSSNNSGSGSSLHIDNCLIQSGNNVGVGVDHVQGYTLFKNGCEVSRYQYQIQCAAGTVEILNTILDGLAANEVIRISGGVVTCGYSTIKNATANSSGVNLTTAGAVFGMGDATFAIATGTGYCVNGVAGAFFLYGHITYSNSAAAAYNVKVRGTVITALPTTQAFTSV